MGYATLFGDDGRPMHKSWGNSIEFNEAAERMGVDVMRWMYAKQRPEDNILFGYRTADEARRELLVLWNVFAFFMTYARLADWQPAHDGAAGEPIGRSTAGSCRAPPRRPPSHGAELADFDARARHSPPGRAHRRPVDLVPAPQSRGACRATPTLPIATWRSRRCTGRSSGTARMLAPILPFLSEYLYQQLVVALDARRARLGPPDALAGR